MDSHLKHTKEEWIQELGQEKITKESMPEMKVQWDSSDVPRNNMIEYAKMSTGNFIWIGMGMKMHSQCAQQEL